MTDPALSHTADAHAHAHGHGHGGYHSRLFEWLTTVDHKQIGIMYLVTSLFFLVIGGVEALLIRAQLAYPNCHFLSETIFNQMFTMHGTTMVFLVGMPTLAGFQNYLVPLMIGARDVAFPRLNAMSFWMLPFSGVMLHFSFLTGAAPSVGWFSYAPLSEHNFTSNLGPDYWALGLLAAGIGSVGSAFNIIVTVIKFRAPGMSIPRLPLFVWMSFMTSILVILALPALNSGLVMLIADRLLNGSFFQHTQGGDPLLWEHIFWIFGHPEVYILILPSFGIISEVIPVFSRRPITGYAFVAWSTLAIALLSFGVWAHHMFAAGLGLYADAFFSLASMLIAIPTGVKIFNWTATMWRGRIRFSTAMLFCLGFLIIFVVGGLSGITLAVTPIDWAVTDSYYIIAHFHYVLFGGTIFGFFAGIYYWYPKMTGRMLDESLGRWHFWGTMIGFNLTFFVQHFLGFMGMPRRIYTYPDLPGWGLLNMISTIGAFLLAVGTLPFVWNLVVSLYRGKIAGDNPWNAWTLEWATSSPPPHDNFALVPPVEGRRPLWDLNNPHDPDWKREPVRDEPPVKMDRNKVLMIFFIASEAMFFTMLISAYILFNSRQIDGPTAASSLKFGRTLFFTIALLSSSVTMFFAEKCLHHKNRRGFVGWMIATIILGFIFLGGQGYEYAELFHDGVTVGRNIFGSTFFTLTGFHGFHVFMGLVSLIVFLILGWKGDLDSPQRIQHVEAAGWYWHFVDVVWVVLFSLIYIKSLLFHTL
ncbi:MAG: cytochrome c oxidase subunit I [Verrucomicrobium sp.]|nr:cytochrome c oxidase subunit I [Verrucomicrobium sp.]